MICLDNSVLRRFASPEPSPAVDSFLAEYASVPWTIPATVAFEYYVHYDSQPKIRRQKQELNTRFDGILPFTDAVAAEAAQMNLLLEKQNVSLPIADLLHAATAREAGVTFVTRDAADFDKEPIKQLMSIEIVQN